MEQLCFKCCHAHTILNLGTPIVVKHFYKELLSLAISVNFQHLAIQKNGGHLGVRERFIFTLFGIFFSMVDFKYLSGLV